jgi:Uma2 family endonuclease
MATAQQTKPVVQNQRIILHNISWETYEHLLADHVNASAPRFTYDRGDLEIMSPLSDHEETNRAIALLVDLLLAEWEINARNLGSTTFRRQDAQRGFEPDSCFYVERAPAIRGKRHVDLRVDPAPDLVIEIDITHSSIDKLALFAALDVSEVWRYDAGRIGMLILESDGYAPTGVSRVLPGVTADDVSTLVAEVELHGRAAWLRRVQAWARTLPRP